MGKRRNKYKNDKDEVTRNDNSDSKVTDKCSERYNDNNGNKHSNVKRDRNSNVKRGRDAKNRNADKSKAIINNAAWYIKDPELRKQVASYNMNSTIGLPTRMYYNSMISGGTGLVKEPYEMNVPSILAMECNPSPGYTPDPESGKVPKAAINKAARMIYSDISSVNAKTTQYQPQDLVFAILAVGEIISMVSHLTRMYGVAFNYSMRNRDLPTALLKAMKVDPDSLMNDLSGFRMRLNSILVTANQITMFSNIPYFEKCWDIYSSIYTDSLSTMSQIYMTVPYSTWVMDELAEGGTKLVTHKLEKIDGGLLLAREWLDILEDMVDTMLTSTTYNYIYTDILNYVGKKGGSLYSFGYVSEMYRITPIYNLEYLLQIHNSVPYGIPINNDVSQNVALNSIEFRPSLEKSRPVKFMDKVLDFPHTSNPSDDDKINAIMYHVAETAGSKLAEGSFYEVGAAELPDHYPVQYTILTGTSTIHSEGFHFSSAAGYHSVVDAVTKFDWAPLVYTVDNDGYVISVIGDLNFYDTIPYDNIAETFDYAYLGLFTIGN